MKNSFIYLSKLNARKGFSLSYFYVLEAPYFNVFEECAILMSKRLVSGFTDHSNLYHFHL